jgi:hypothetical protein
MMSDTLNARSELLRGAENAVNGDRNAQYGDPRADFLRTADMWNAYIAGVMERQDGCIDLKTHDVAAMMCLLKISRISWSPEKQDSWMDLAGYAACGWDCSDHNHHNGGFEETYRNAS